MKILTSAIIKEWDAYTIANEPIASIDLMERAANAFCNQVLKANLIQGKSIIIICGLGNNGGDGLAIGRILIEKGYEIKVHVIEYSQNKSEEFEKNLQKLNLVKPIQIIENEASIPIFSDTDLVIDAIFGNGLNRSTDGIVKKVIQRINNSNCDIISVDIASGLFSNSQNKPDDIIIKPSHTITFELPKLAFLLPQNQQFVGKWHAVSIGLSANFIEKVYSKYYYTNSAGNLIKRRPKFSNKGTHGHALLIVGSLGMMGAAILSARACMRSGIGKLTVEFPKSERSIIQITVPEALIKCIDSDGFSLQLSYYEQYSAIGIGCGIGRQPETVAFLKWFLAHINQPLVIDADALNIIAENDFHHLIPKNSILTPHPKEFERLIGKNWLNDYEKLDLLLNFSVKHQVTIVLKGAHTAVALPNGTIHFNSTGNSGMAKAGTGDVLTGMITALLGQNYNPADAAILGVFEHGLAGDLAVIERSEYSILAADIIENIRFKY